MDNPNQVCKFEAEHISRFFAIVQVVSRMLRFRLAVWAC
ncbi:hypothetical protein MPQ_0543 [Methylovorus sp. MP688]|nr:hypothetical protein MPQ_0543 [Methylovorus sp. MP688]